MLANHSQSRYGFSQSGCALLSLFLATSPPALWAQANVLTCHNDNARTGLNPNETILTRTNVDIYGFGKIFSQPLDGPMYAQPLYVSNVSVPGKGIHNIVFAATMHDSVYAFDADNNNGPNAAPLWKVSFLNPAGGVTAPSTIDVGGGSGDCRTFEGEVGIVGTPVIDGSNANLFVVARTKEPLPPPNNQTYVQVHRLHALDISTGIERSNSPVVIAGTVPGTGAGSSGGFINFNSLRHVQRSGLLLVGGVVYVSWCSYCDFDPYHGWIMGYDSQTLQQVGVFNATPNSRRGGFWMGGAGLAAAPDGSIYCVTGDGTFGPSANPTDFGDSYLKLTQGVNLTNADYFTPYNQADMELYDYDLGSSGVLVLPDSVGSVAHPHLMVGAGKVGRIYLIDRDNLGHFNAANDNQIVQFFSLYSLGSNPHFFGLPAFFNNRLYVQGVGEYMKAYAFTNGQMNTTPVTQSTETLGFRGGTPSISANGTNNGIVWILAPTASVNPSFRALNADNLSQKLYDSYTSSQSGLPDVLSFVKFVVPTVVNGKVYLGTIGSLAVFGLRSFIWSSKYDPAANSIHVVFSGPTGLPNVLQASEDLVHWSNLGPGTPTGSGTYSYDDPLVPGRPARFYRVGQN